MDISVIQLAYNITFYVGLAIELYLAVGLLLRRHNISRECCSFLNKITITEQPNMLVVGLHVTYRYMNSTKTTFSLFPHRHIKLTSDSHT